MPITYKRPGTYVEEVITPQRIASQNFDVAFGAFVGATERGSTDDPILVQSWSEFNRLFGGFKAPNSTSLPLPNAVYQFFSNNGRACYIKRVVGDGATKAYLSLFDSAENEVMSIEAKSAGAWSVATANGSGLYILVENTTPSFTIDTWEYSSNVASVVTTAAHGFTTGDTVYVTGADAAVNGKRVVIAATSVTSFTFAVDAGSDDGSGGSVSPNPETFSLSVYYNGSQNLVERFSDLTMNPASSRYAKNVINSTSSWITAYDNPTSYTDYLAPVSSSGGEPQSLTGGDDGDAIVPSDITDASASFDQVQQSLIFNIPDAAYFSDSGDALEVINHYVSYVDEKGDGFVVIDTPNPISGMDQITDIYPVSDAISFVASITPKSANAAVYYPWVKVPDPSSNAVGALKTVPPGGGVLGYIISNDSVNGVWKAPAGVGSQLKNVVATSRNLSSSDLDDINSATYAFNAIRPIPGSGLCVMGARTISTDRNSRYINTRRTLLQAKNRLANLTQFVAFENNSPILWEQIRTITTIYLNGLWQAGGLKGSTAAQAFYVICDATNNTPESISEGIVNIEVGVALQTPAEFVVIRIGQFDGSTSVSIQE